MQTSPSTRKRPPPLFLLVVLLLMFVPTVVGAIALMRSQSALREREAQIARVPFMITAWEQATCEPVAAREGVIIAYLNMQGGTIFRTAAAPFDEVDARFGPWPPRDEVQAALAGNRTFGRYGPSHGLTLVTLAQPRPEGGALYVLGTSDRGFSRLTFALTEVASTVVVILLIVFWRLRRGREATPP